MKLIGSRQEKKYREELKQSHWSLFHKNANLRLLKALKNICPDMRTAYVIEWVPDQGEDIYEVLIDTNIIVWVELDRIDFDSEPIVEKASVVDYLKKLKKLKKIKLLVALELAAKDIEILNN